MLFRKIDSIRFKCGNKLVAVQIPGLDGVFDAESCGSTGSLSHGEAGRNHSDCSHHRPFGGSASSGNKQVVHTLGNK